jgi:hypothetical protein
MSSAAANELRPVIRVMADTRKSTRAGDARRDGAWGVTEIVSPPTCPVDPTQIRYSTAYGADGATARESGKTGGFGSSQAAAYLECVPEPT